MPPPTRGPAVTQLAKDDEPPAPATSTTARRRRGRPRTTDPTLPQGIYRVLGKDGRQVMVKTTDGQLLPKWRIRVYDRRTQEQSEWTVVATLDDADHFAATHRQLRNHTVTPLTAPRLKAAEYLTVHLAAYAFRADGITLRPYATWAKHRSMLETYLLPALGEHVIMREVTTQMLQDAIAGLRKVPTKEQRAAGKPGDPVSGWTSATVAGSAKTFFREALRAGVVLTNPAEALPMAWGQRSDRRALIIPSVTQAELLAGAMNEVWPEVSAGAIVRLFTYAGPRMEELVALHADRVYPKQRRARLSRTATVSGGRREWRSAAEEHEDLAAGASEGMKTSNAARNIILIDQVMPAVRELEMRRRRMLAGEAEREAKRAARRAALAGTGREPKRTYLPSMEERWQLLVTNELGGPLSYSTWRRKLKEARALLEKRGTPVTYTAHELRHVCASLLIASGAQAEEVAAQMGHATEAFTKRVYGHLWPTDMSALADRVSATVARLSAAEVDAIRKPVDERDDDPWGFDQLGSADGTDS